MKNQPKISATPKMLNKVILRVEYKVVIMADIKRGSLVRANRENWKIVWKLRQVISAFRLISLTLRGKLWI